MLFKSMRVCFFKEPQWRNDTQNIKSFKKMVSHERACAKERIYIYYYSNGKRLIGLILFLYWIPVQLISWSDCPLPDYIPIWWRWITYIYVLGRFYCMRSTAMGFVVKEIHKPRQIIEQILRRLRKGSRTKIKCKFNENGPLHILVPLTPRRWSELLARTLGCPKKWKVVQFWC